MSIHELEIPDRGTVYAVYKDHIVYGSYHKSDMGNYTFPDGSTVKHTEIDQNPELLELHMFDRNREYRCVRTRRRGMLEILIDDENISEEYEDFYEEEIYILGGNVDQNEGFKKKVGVVNYIRYNEDDLIVIDQYRLKEVE